MQIRIIKNENGIEEWAILDIQGKLEINGSVDGQTFGNFQWEEKDKTAKLIVGHQLYVGELVKLEKPLLVVNRKSIRGENNLNEDLLLSEENMLCDVVAVVRRKIVFSERPKPIISTSRPQ